MTWRRCCAAVIAALVLVVAEPHRTKAQCIPDLDCCPCPGGGWSPVCCSGGGGGYKALKKRCRRACRGDVASCTSAVAQAGFCFAAAPHTPKKCRAQLRSQLKECKRRIPEPCIQLFAEECMGAGLQVLHVGAYGILREVLRQTIVVRVLVTSRGPTPTSMGFRPYFYLYPDRGAEYPLPLVYSRAHRNLDHLPDVEAILTPYCDFSTGLPDGVQWPSAECVVAFEGAVGLPRVRLSFDSGAFFAFQDLVLPAEPVPPPPGPPEPVCVYWCQPGNVDSLCHRCAGSCRNPDELICGFLGEVAEGCPNGPYDGLPPCN